MRYHLPCVYNRRITQVLRSLGIEFNGPETERYVLQSYEGQEIQVISDVEELVNGTKSRTVTIDMPQTFHGHKISCPQIKYELMEVGEPQDLNYFLYEFPISYRHDADKTYFQIRGIVNGKSMTNIILHNETMRQLLALGKQLVNKKYKLVQAETITIQ